MRRERIDATVALAMLPVGGVLLVVSVLAFVAVCGFMLALPLLHEPGWRWYLAWSLVALGVAVKNAIGGIETMSSFEPRPAAAVLGWSLAILALWPDWYIP